jgi:CheY-like chemotaxis protein
VGVCDILVVEDDLAIRCTIAECLEFEGYRVRVAASSAEALDEIARHGVPALILLDVVMPGMTGRQLLDVLRGEPSTSRVPVVVMTAAAPALTAPFPDADAFLAKPFELRDLLGVVANWCGPASAAAAAPS